MSTLIDLCDSDQEAAIKDNEVSLMLALQQRECHNLNSNVSKIAKLYLNLVPNKVISLHFPSRTILPAIIT